MGGGGKGGGGSSGGGDNAYTKALGRISNTTFNESTPLRQSITHTIGDLFGITNGAGGAGTPTATGGDTGWVPKSQRNQSAAAQGDWQNVLNAPTIPGLFGATPAERQAIEAQYGIARNNALNNGMRGSTLGRALTEVDLSRAANVSNLVGAEKQRALQTALGVAYNTPMQTQQGLSAAASNATAQQQLAAQQQAAAGQGAGGLLGGMMGGKK